MHSTLAYAYPAGPKRSATSLGVPQAGPSTPALRSAPPATGSNTVLPMATTNRLGRIDPIIKRKVQPSAPDTHLLQEEIGRLTKACEEHERKIRSSKSTIEHRVFLEFPNMISRLNELDDQADEFSASLQATLRNSLPDLQKRLDEIVYARRADVETMRERTTPWRHLEFEEADDGHAMEEEDPGRIPRVEGVGSSDELARIEGWANEVENYLTSEIVRLRENIQHTSIRRKAWRYFIYAVCTAVALLISIILVGFTAR